MWGRIRVRSCNRQLLVSLNTVEVARRLEVSRPRIADRRPPALRGVFLLALFVGGDYSYSVVHFEPCELCAFVCCVKFVLGVFLSLFLSE